MRVGFLTYGMAGEMTGIGSYARHLTYALAGADPSVEIVLLNPNAGSELEWYRDFECHSFRMLTRLPALVTLGPAILAGAVKGLGLDILHDPSGVAPFAAPRRGVRRVVTIHDAIPYVMPRSHALLTNIVFRTLIPLSRWTADAVITVSRRSAEDLSRHAHLPRDLITVTYPGVKVPDDDVLERLRSLPAPEPLRLHDRRPFFLHVGSRGRRKNIPVLLRAFQRVHERWPDVRLLLVGPGSAPCGEEIPGAVHPVGYVDELALEWLYANAAGVVYPSAYEGFGLPVLEGMAFGAPVITSNVSSLPEIADGCCLLADPGDEVALSEHMLGLLVDHRRRAELGTRGRERARQFTWRRTAEETLSVYSRVLAA